ncbi:GNAT family N-acetyltransferase [Streptomyces gilvus]|uniref:GNAT family N-acetyltransferase n=1 Tax=Streptomyces gilvus TaxID=2920937 RepID=UPI001F10F9FE|nr:GNAT family N-acetyltransferase [Streptomyces sp. CME 23]MCH5671647.1 GNAT family N-acetyltransferase [Streptomyces sp. CME 23]
MTERPPRVKPEPFRTPRLDAVPLSVEHAAEMAVVLSDPALHAFIGGAPASPDALRARYERLVTGCPDPAVSWCNWVLRLREEARLVGTVQATVVGAVAEIAWVVGTPWQGRGLASEATRGLVSLLVEQTCVRTVIAHVHPAHRASESVARAAGLEPTEVERDGERRWRLELPG